MLGQAAAPATVPAPAPVTATEPTEETVKLSPFVVSADEDQGNYTATATLAGTRVRTDLKDVASSISVVTKQFLQDTGSKNAQDLLVYTPNTEVGGLRGNYSGQAGNIIYNEPLGNPNGVTRVRGLDTADNTRDYFLTDIPWDNFNVGRVDLQRGPNSILFGVGSPAGIINSSLNGAAFKSAYKVENVTSSYASQRNLLDFNQVLLSDELAIRFAAVNDQQKYRQVPAFNNSTRYYGALRFDPKLFNSESAHTSFRANYENGSVKSNNPRIIPPDDQITPWFSTTLDTYHPGLTPPAPAQAKIVFNEYVPGQGAGSDFVKQTLNGSSWALGRVYWPTPIAYFNGSPSSSPGSVPAVLSNLPTTVTIGEIGTGWAINGTGLIAAPNQPGGSYNGIGGLPNFQPKAVPNYAHYAAARLPGGSYYANKVLTDSSVFDFYNNLLDGPNKREWQNWNAFNIALSQTFLDDRVGFEVAYDQQDYKQGQVGFISSENYAINVDVNATMTDGSRNLNLGRPYVAAGFENGNQSQETKRDSTRVTAFGEVRASDWLGNTTLAKILGRHVFTGLAAVDHRRQTNVNWSQYAAGQDWETNNNFDLSTKIANYRLFNWVDYIGPSLQGASSAANAHLSNVSTIITPGANTSVRWFDSHWNHSLVPGTTGYVDPSASASPVATAPPGSTGYIQTANGWYNPAGYYAPGHDPATWANGNAATVAANVYSYLNSDNAGNPIQNNQANNPANYVGWKQLPVTWLNANDPKDFPSLVTGGSKTKFRDISKALIYQGYFLDNDLVATYGWRRDSIVSYNTNAPVNGATSLSALDYPDDPTSRLTTDGQTRTWGGVYHFPKFIMKHIPGDTSFSVFYNEAHNFNAGNVRKNYNGDQIPNPDGMTKEYGIQAGVLGDKITLKVTHYETTVHFATLSGDALNGLGGLGYYTDLIPGWGYGYAAQVQAGLDGKYGNTTVTSDTGGDTAGGTQWNYVARDALIQNSSLDNTTLAASGLGIPANVATKPVATYGYSGTGPVSMTDIVNAWLKMPVSDSFFDFYGMTGNRPQPALAHSTGKLYLGFSQPMVGSSLSGVGGQQPSGSRTIVATVDNVSKGFEYELSAQPLKNWNVAVNYSKTEATKTNIDAMTQKFMADNLAFYKGPGGQLRLWGASQKPGNGTNLTPTGPLPTYAYVAGQSNGSTVGPDWIAGVYNPYTVIASAQGQSTPEVSPWRLNLVTTYTIDRGILKHAFVGGGVRMEAGRILGYKLAADNLTLNVNQPLTGPSDTHYDLWVGYSAKFSMSRNINWRIQLNLRNVGQGAHLVPAGYEPDGSLALARIQDGMTWQLTNTFEF